MGGDSWNDDGGDGDGDGDDDDDDDDDNAGDTEFSTLEWAMMVLNIILMRASTVESHQAPRQPEFQAGKTMVS